MMLGHDWRNCYTIFKRDGKKTDSPNAGYPMAALAGALGTKLEKIEHYSLGTDNQEITSKSKRSNYFDESYIITILWNCFNSYHLVHFTTGVDFNCLNKLVLSFHF